MNDNVLNSTKKLLGIHEECCDFDVDILMHINTTFTILSQLGVGPSNGYPIIDEVTRWTDVLAENDPMFQPIKTYVYFRVRSFFDPPQTSSVAEAVKNTIAELEFRLMVNVDLKKNE